LETVYIEWRGIIRVRIGIGWIVESEYRLDYGID